MIILDACVLINSDVCVRISAYSTNQSRVFYQSG